MNKILSLIVITFLFFSCDSFLEEESQDQIVPKTPSELKEFLFGEAYLKLKRPKDYYLDLMSDDVAEFTKSYGTEYRLDDYGYYTWQQIPENGLGDEKNLDNAYGYYYHQILMSNIVLDMLETMDGKENEVLDAKGEAYFIIANAYFMLVNLYGEPYNKETAEVAKGVPIDDNIGVKDIYYERSSVADVYRKISTNIQKSVKCLHDAQMQKTIFRITEAAANVLASRIHLYMQDWDNSIAYADRAIELNSILCDLNNYDDKKFICSSNPEILFTYGANHMNLFAKYGGGVFTASTELYEMYSDEDLRKDLFFLTYRSTARPVKGFASTNDIYDLSIRTSEAYLNRAEAYAEKSEISNAIDDVNRIRKNRYSTNNDASASNKEEALVIVKNERRKELCFEQQRWFDLRRWGMPRIEHKWTNDPNNPVTVTYVLEKGDKAYTLPLPSDVIGHNNIIENIDRPIRNHN